VDRLALDFPHQLASLRFGRVGRTAAGRRGARQCPGRSTPWASYCLHQRLLRLWKHCCMAARRRHIWRRV
jgi:hypothetical protein